VSFDVGVRAALVGREQLVSPTARTIRQQTNASLGRLLVAFISWDISAQWPNDEDHR
jgi:hypothetical protein